MRSIRDWPEAALGGWEDLTRNARDLAEDGPRGRDHHRYLAEVEQLIDQDRLDRLARRLGTIGVLRALLLIWEQDDLRTDRSLRPDLFEAALSAAEAHPEGTLLTRLTSLHLHRFDELDEAHEGLFVRLADHLTQAFTARAEHSGQRRHSLLAVLSNEPALLSREGPDLLAQRIVEADENLKAYLRRLGLTALDRGRYGQLLRQRVYIERLMHCDAEHDEGLDFLIDLRGRDLLHQRGLDGRYFGHDVLEALTDQATNKPCRLWITTMLEVGGDPRLEHTKTWLDWWEPLSESARTTGRRWLSRDDLRLFLRAVEEFAEERGKSDLQRMFPARQRFLTGLYETGLVQQTRLIMSVRAQRFVRRTLKSAGVQIATLTGAVDTAIIVVDCGDFHLVEGSHSFSLWIYAGVPTRDLFDWTTKSFQVQWLRSSLPRLHAERSPWGDGGHVDVRHHGFWQKPAVDFIVEELGVELDLHELMSISDYNTLKRERGLPIPGSRRLRSP